MTKKSNFLLINFIILIIGFFSVNTNAEDRYNGNNTDILNDNISFFVNEQIKLGDPLYFSDFLSISSLPVHTKNISSTGGFVVDSKKREEVRAFFNTVYQASENIPIEWTGNVDECLPGTTSRNYLEATLLRVNYFRSMAGVPGDITFNDEFNRKAQQAALMMAVNGELDHFPPEFWTCYTEEGAEAARSSNLSGGHGPLTITAYMEDFGDNNFPVGHRRWILFPQTQVMGVGNVRDDTVGSANALWVFDGNTFASRPATRDKFVSWPPNGFVPYQLVFPQATIGSDLESRKRVI